MKSHRNAVVFFVVAGGLLLGHGAFSQDRTTDSRSVLERLRANQPPPGGPIASDKPSEQRAREPASAPAPASPRAERVRPEIAVTTEPFVIEGARLGMTRDELTAVLQKLGFEANGSSFQMDAAVGRHIAVASYDPATGLANRIAWRYRLNEDERTAKREMIISRYGAEGCLDNGEFCRWTSTEGERTQVLQLSGGSTLSIGLSYE